MKKYICIICIITLLTSCNNSRIEELENQVIQQRNVIESQKQRISELEDQLSECEDYYNQQVTAASDAEIHIIQAQQHMRSAEFWRQSGDEFLYECEMRNAQSELNMISVINSQH